MSQIDNPEISQRFRGKMEEAKETASFADFLLGKVQQTFTIVIQDDLELEFREPTNNDKVRLMKIGSIGSRLYQESQISHDSENLDEIDRMISLASETIREIDLFLESMTIDTRLTADNFYAKLPATIKETIITEIKDRAGLQANKALKTRKK